MKPAESQVVLDNETKKKSGVSLCNKVTLCKAVEFTVITAMTVIIWGLASVPAVIYFINRYSADSQVLEPMANNDMNGMCSQVPYEGGLCQSVLVEIQPCVVNSTHSNVFTVSSEVDQDQSHNKIPLLSPSPECEAVLVPFLCQYLFTLCDGDGKPHYPSSEECVNIRDKVCVEEWKTAERFLGTSQLPACESLPALPICWGKNVSCFSESTDSITNDTTGGNSSPLQCPMIGDVGPTNGSLNATLTPLECKEDFFYRKELHQCRPLCSRWKQHSYSVSLMLDIIRGVVSGLGGLMCIAVFFISCLRHKQMFKFPTVFIVYQTATVLLFAVTALITFTDRRRLYCSSEDLVEVLLSKPATPFCKYTGTVFIYALWQLSLWWLFHIVAVFCGVNFPFRMQSFQKSPHAKYLHIILALTGIILPIVPVIVLLSVEDFISTGWPPFFCFSRNADVTFYAVILPITLIYAVGITLMIIIVKKVAKGWRYSKNKRSKRSVAVAKLLFLFCYITVLVIFDMTTFTVSTHSKVGKTNMLLDYFQCESFGIHPDREKCIKNVTNVTSSTMASIGTVLLIIYPFLCLLYAINTSDIRERLVAVHKRLSSAQLKV